MRGGSGGRLSNNTKLVSHSCNRSSRRAHSAATRLRLSRKSFMRRLSSRSSRPFLSKSWVMKNVFRFNEDEIEAMELEIQNEGPTEDEPAGDDDGN